MRLAKHSTKNLFYIYLTGLVRKRRQNVGKRAIPALLESIDRDDIADLALWAQEIHALKLINVCRLDSDLLGRDAGAHQLVTQFLD